MNEMPRSDGENRIASFALSPKRLQQHPGGADEEEEEEEKEEEREKQRPSNLRLGPTPPQPPAFSPAARRHPQCPPAKPPSPSIYALPTAFSVPSQARVSDGVNSRSPGSVTRGSRAAWRCSPARCSSGGSRGRARRGRRRQRCGP
jgi:hypothetical protein